MWEASPLSTSYIHIKCVWWSQIIVIEDSIQVRANGPKDYHLTVLGTCSYSTCVSCFETNHSMQKLFQTICLLKGHVLISPPPPSHSLSFSITHALSFLHSIFINLSDAAHSYFLLYHSFSYFLFVSLFVRNTLRKC